MARIGVFVCHCGENISRTVDVKAVAEGARKVPGVVFSADYKYMCSQPGQDMVKDAIVKHRLTGLVVAACSPRMHEATFRNAAASAGLNPFLVELANIREHCSWVHENRAEATAKAHDIVRMTVERVKHNEPLTKVTVPVTRRVLVIGAGIAGIQTALDMANAGIEVVLIERRSSIGGRMAQLSETFPTMDCSQCILMPRMVEVAQHPKIKLLTCTTVEEMSGYIGNFKVKLRREGTSVDPDLCTGCGACLDSCPVKKITSEFNRHLDKRSAIYVPFAQAIPNKPVVDRENCILYKDAKRKGILPEDSKVCGKCRDACPIAPRKAIDFSRGVDTVETVEVGAIVVCTGFNLISRAELPEYGGGELPDVIDSLQFERMASASGPTSGEIRRPSDGQIPKHIVFIQCAGSRDKAKGRPYCSRICCMYTAKHTMLYKHKVHDGQATVFYMDVRAAGKGYDEFWRRAVEEEGARYVRGRVARVYQQGGKLMVKGVDTIAGKSVEMEADMVVLAAAVRAQNGADVLARKLGIGYDKYQFFTEAHPKLRPFETNTAGIFLAGSNQAPKAIPETVAQASGAAAKVMVLFSSDKLEREPVVAKINEANCSACWYCLENCPYQAIEKKEIKDKSGKVLRVVAQVNAGVCQGCGVCAATCRSHCADLAGFNEEQVYAQIMAY